MKREEVNVLRKRVEELESEVARRQGFEEALQQSGKRFRLLAETVQEGVCVTDKDACTTYVAPHLAEMLGYPPEEMRGKCLYSFVDEHDAGICQRAMDRCQGGTGEQYDLELLGKDGTRIHAVMKASPLTDEHGDYAGAIVAFRNATQQVAIEKELQERQERYRLLTENVEDGIWATDMDMRLTYVSPSAKRLRGYDADEELSQPLESMLTPASLEHATKVFREQLATEKRKRKSLNRSWTLELEACRRDGSTIWVEEKVTFLRDSMGCAVGLLGVTRDITERKRAEEALKESESNFRLVTESIQDVYWMSTPGMKEMIHVSPAYEKVWGRSRQSLYKSPTSYFKTIHREDRARVLARIRRRAEEKWDSEYRIVKPDGSVRWIRDRRFPVRDESGKVHLLTGVATDITERKEAEKALLESQLQLSVRNKIASIFLTIPDDEMYGDVLQVILQATGSRYGIFGYVDDNGVLVLPSLTGEIWEQCRVPGKAILYPPETWGGLWGRALIERRSLYANEGLHVPRGHIPVERVLIVPVLYKEEAIGLLEVANKATDYDEKDRAFLEAIADKIAPVLHARLQREREERRRKRAEEAMRESQERFIGVYERSPIGIALYDGTGRLVHMNKACLDMFGLSDVSQAAAPPLLSAPLLSDKAKARLAAGKTARHEGPFDLNAIRDVGLYATTRSGTIYLDVLITPLGVQEGTRASGYLVQIQDITERKRAEEMLTEAYHKERDLRQKLEAEIKTRVEFTRALVHELKTPLTPVLAASSALTEILDEGTPLEFARNIARGASRLSGRIDELFDLTRGETGMLDLSWKQVDLLSVLHGIADEMIPVALTRDQSLILDLPPSLPPVRADDSRLKQVVLNLLSNALKFTPEGGKVVLRAKEEDQSLVVEVQDNGPGIPGDEQEWLFQPYRRLRSGTRPSGGLGLGLALSKTLVELHGGRIWVQSREGRGSTFSFSVPLEITHGEARSKTKEGS
jgi:PAS domain S-box-containing protein